MDNSVLYTDKITGKDVVKELVFKGDKDNAFKSISEAEGYLRDNSYSIGSTQRDAPIGIAKKIDGENVYIAKWYNIDQEEYKFLDGIMISDDFRNGDVKILFFN